MRIGVFDSGIGGLTVLKSLVAALPHADFVYVGDTARVPYGNKTPETVTRYALELAGFLRERAVEQVVVACNTASSVALPALRAGFHLPLFEVIRPAVREAVRITRTGNVGVIGTRSTIGSGAYARTATEIQPAVRVTSAACPLFVPLVEEDMATHASARLIAETYLEPLRTAKVDTLILGCTHYPLMASVIQELMGPEVALVTSSDAVAKEVSEAVGEAADGPSGRLELWATDDALRMHDFAQRILGTHVPPVELLSLAAPHIEEARGPATVGRSPGSV